ncbi:hypothetical protein KCP77_19460 [Salmonella enterica subsp. enterica]|nr:hypothetical protein KCP77_19460 [Salmonella enterica subsp. enterica]
MVHETVASAGWVKNAVPASNSAEYIFHLYFSFYDADGLQVALAIVSPASDYPPPGRKGRYNARFPSLPLDEQFTF